MTHVDHLRTTHSTTPGSGRFSVRMLLTCTIAAIAVTGCSTTNRVQSPEVPATHAAPWAGTAVIKNMPDFRLSPQTFFKQEVSAKDGRKVFAWYMVCCTPFGGGDAPMEQKIAQFKAEIQMAQSMGIDGFGLDIMRANKDYHTSIEAMFLAAEQLGSGFKLFFEFDYGQGSNENAADMVALMKQYGKHPCHQQVDGRPLVCAYAADDFVTENDKPLQAKSIAWWRDSVIKPLQAAGIEISFVPTTWQQIRNSGGDMATTKAEIANWGDVAQGMSIWQIQTSPIGGGMKLLERQAVALHEAKKTWMTTISMHYWVGSSRSVPSWYWKPGQAASADCINGTYFEHAGGKGLDMQWQSAMDTQRADWVMMLTWNDYNESYLAPIDDYRKYPNGTAQAPLGWYKPRAGLDELNRYYIQWYKTGVRPTITADGLFFTYRTHSQKLIASDDPRPPVKIGNGPIGDDIYVTTALTAPARLQVTSGGTTRQFDVGAGIQQTLLPFAVGAQSFSLWRDGKQIAAVDGEPVVGSIKFYDYWPTTGHVIAKPGK